MKKFEFRLAAALKLRENQLKSERLVLQQLFGEEQQLRAAVDRLAADRQEATAFIHNSPSVSASDVRALSTFSLGADARSRMLAELIAVQVKKIHEQKARLMLAERKVRLLTKLREKKFEVWSQEVDREIEMAAQESWLSKRHVEVSRQRNST